MPFSRDFRVFGVLVTPDVEQLISRSRARNMTGVTTAQVPLDAGDSPAGSVARRSRGPVQEKKVPRRGVARSQLVEAVINQSGVRP